MSIRLSGAVPVDFTFTSNGTRADLVTNFQTQLVAAGWSVVSGGGTGDVVLESATTPQGLKTRVEAIDPGSGNCAQFKIRDGSTLVGPITIFLLPVNGSVFRLWADPFQFFYFLSGTDMTKQRSLVCGGTPWIPQFIQDLMTSAYAGWIHGPGNTDTSTNTAASSFRQRLTLNSIVNYSAIWNGSVFGVAGTGNFGLLVQTGTTAIDDMWDDGTFTIFEPVLCWQSASFPNPVRHGQMWDAVLGSKPLDSEVRRIIGGFTWRNITHQSGNRFGIMLLVPT